MGQNTSPAHNSTMLTGQTQSGQKLSPADKREQAEEWCRALLDMSRDAMLVCDPEYHIISWNQGAANLYGWSALEAKGQISTVLLKARTSSSTEAIEQALSQTGQWEGQIQHTHRAGHPITVACQRKLLHNDLNATTVILEVHHPLPAYVESESSLETQVQQATRFLDHISDGFFHVDEQWRLTFINARGEQIVGRPRHELQGKEVWLLFPDLLGTTFEEQARLAMTTRQSLQFEAQHENTQSWFSVQFHPADPGLFVYYNDITAYKRIELALRASEARFRRLLIEANIVGLAVTDEHGDFIEANDAFLAMLGYTREEFAAHSVNWRTLTPTEYTSRDQHAVQELFTAGACQPYEKEFFTRTGARVPVLMAGARLIDDTSRSVIALIVDMTAQKEVEKQRETFLSIMGHELRTPLTAISGSIQLAQHRIQRFRETTNTSLADVQTLLSKLDILLEQSLRQTRVQNRLINDLLDISRLAVDKLELVLQPCDLVSIVDETVGDLRFTGSKRDIQFTAPPQAPLMVLADSERIAQVVANYITNALKYSPDSSPVHVEMTTDTDNAYVWVRDQGPGLSPEEQKHIWDRYYRSPNIKDQQGHGTNLGLGLYICRALIKRQHGQVGVNSTVGEGSSFWFSLPLLKI